ncbi:hypothetical protein [Okeania sp.]|nr:hypothetical protein [Okeania sp.]MEB3343725.1 hypothetical protein [Okeania sp.]
MTSEKQSQIPKTSSQCLSPVIVKIFKGNRQVAGKLPLFLS